MSEQKPFKRTASDESTIVQIGSHDDIEVPFFAPEVKDWRNDLRVTLDYRELLDENNPILVPGWNWDRLRNLNIITSRTDEDGTEIGDQEVEQLEENHPLVWYEPPEFYAFKGKTDLLRTYLLKRDEDARDTFKNALLHGNVTTALEQVPRFARPFLRTNLNKVADDLEIPRPVDVDYDVPDSMSDVWCSLEDDDYSRYFGTLAKEALERPSAVVVPPVPLLRDYNPELVTALCTANSKMATMARENGKPRAYFHLYLHYTAFDDSVTDDTASRALNILMKEIDQHAFAGIALTIYKGAKVFEASRRPRVETFLGNLSSFADEQGLPLILPRSEWLGLYACDFGIDGFSALYNGNWVYRSGGDLDSDIDKYGKTMSPGESRALKLVDDQGESVVQKVSSGEFEPIEGLPEEPPEPPDAYDPNTELQERFGSSFYYRRKFGKPQKLNHLNEVRAVRSGSSSESARNVLESSENDYVEFEG
jgi:hypothetical protein